MRKNKPGREEAHRKRGSACLPSSSYVPSAPTMDTAAIRAVAPKSRGDPIWSIAPPERPR